MNEALSLAALTGSDVGEMMDAIIPRRKTITLEMITSQVYLYLTELSNPELRDELAERLELAKEEVNSYDFRNAEVERRELLKDYAKTLRGMMSDALSEVEVADGGDYGAGEAQRWLAYAALDQVDWRALAAKFIEDNT